jgi:hypothetical protein
MWGYGRRILLPRLCFLSALALAGVLLGLVLLAPGWTGEAPAGTFWARLLHLFAEDAMVRRIATAGAGGLVVTAWVFFRPPRHGPFERRRQHPGSQAIGA